MYICSIVAPIEFIPRMGKLGLGAAPKPQAMPVKKGPRKPGETDKKVCVCVCVMNASGIILNNITVGTRPIY